MTAGAERPLLERARQVLALEARAIERVAELLDADFARAIELVLGCQGLVVVTGMGKAGLIGAKISATLASTGTPSFFLDPAQALHGDLGRIRSRDLCLALSNSGGSAEILRLVPHLKRMGVPIVAITSGKETALGQHADAVLSIGKLDEACPLGLAPTASATAMLAVGDALAMVLLEQREFTAQDFALFHPAGDLGRKLIQVREIMRRGEELPLVPEDASIRRAVASIQQTPRNPGCAILQHADGRLAGFFSDGDLRRLIAKGTDLDTPIRNVMTPSPKVIQAEALVSEAMHLLTRHQIDQIIVVDDAQHPIGLLDQQDVLAIKI
ncbi:MAG: KpsF/GutQ family sugar-phosphate isomerase [Planctomycetes bacterium]|nr:KpsF/GutQ family sugar-phosphate isomerase [Planctomycetota bacterium]